ncbi:hypothetical protein DL93DRAFT_2092766 [Clavulina sp. PMI_390]|nr:hypothetical protein DL93DRAFT_2092766 [Clavulina sp. PMI_390]
MVIHVRAGRDLRRVTEGELSHRSKRPLSKRLAKSLTTPPVDPPRNPKRAVPFTRSSAGKIFVVNADGSTQSFDVIAQLITKCAALHSIKDGCSCRIARARSILDYAEWVIQNDLNVCPHEEGYCQLRRDAGLMDFVWSIAKPTPLQRHEHECCNEGGFSRRAKNTAGRLLLEESDDTPAEYTAFERPPASPCDSDNVKGSSSDNTACESPTNNLQ